MRIGCLNEMTVAVFITGNVLINGIHDLDQPGLVLRQFDKFCRGKEFNVVRSGVT